MSTKSYYVMQLLALSVCLLLALSACNKATDTSEKNTGVSVAKVDDHTITVTELEAEVKSLPGGKQRATYPGGYEAVLDRMIDMVLIEKEAGKRNLAESKEYKDAVGAIRARRATEESEVLHKLLFEDVSKNVQISEDELKEYYQQSKNRFLTTAIHLRRIMVKDEKQIREIAKRIKSGGDFTKLALEHNDDDTLKKNSGDMGEMLRNDVPRSLRIAAFSLREPGNVSEPFVLDGNWNMLQLINQSSGVERPYENVRQQLEQELRRKKATEFMNNMLVEQRKVLKVAIDKNELAKLGPVKRAHPSALVTPTPIRSDTKASDDKTKQLIDRGGH